MNMGSAVRESEGVLRTSFPGIRRTTCLIPVLGVGCAGGVIGLNLAKKICAGNSRAVVMVVAAEFPYV